MLSSFQAEIMRLIAENRNPESYVAGGAMLNVDLKRISLDVDIFHDSADSVRKSFKKDLRVLGKNGLLVQETAKSKYDQGFCEALVSRETTDDTVILQWAHESAFRFFPVIEDDAYGFRLHPCDLAVNKVLALAGRREVRDYYDVISLIKSDMPLSALVWAAPGKDPGFSPELLLDEMSRHTSYSQTEFDMLQKSGAGWDIAEAKQLFLSEAAKARDIFAALPPEHMGCLYLDRKEQIHEPDPKGVEEGRLLLHRGSVRGTWPDLSPYPGGRPGTR